MTTQNTNPFGMILSQLASTIKRDEIRIPTTFRERALAVESALVSDSSGLVNSVLDYAISAGCNVDFTLETSNENLTKTLNNWLESINDSMLGKVPTGINALAKQYFIERWKGSSLILMRTLWEDVNGFYLPTRFWFVSGKDVKVDDQNNKTKILGEERYKLTVGNEKYISLPTADNEKIFIQKPFDSWSVDYPVPYVIRRGVYKNMEFLKLLAQKGETIVARALEYMLLIKKGSEELAKLQLDQYTYTKEELTEIKTKLQENLRNQRMEGGVPTYVTNFDTQMEHFIPEYGKILKPELFSTTETHILSGLGFITMRETGNNRQETILNPKVFREEVYSGVGDFKSLMIDVIKQILIENKKRKKYANVEKLQFAQSLIKAFVDGDEKNFLRSVYDRGLLSRETMSSIANVDFDTEVTRKTREEKDGISDILYPPVIQNQEQYLDTKNGAKPADPSSGKSPDKTGPEAKNYAQANTSIEIETSKKNKHTHKSNIVLKYSEIGEILEVSGSTDEVDGHVHYIVNANETEAAADGHKHKLKFEKSDLSIDDKTKIIKYQNLISQKTVLTKLNKDAEDETRD